MRETVSSEPSRDGSTVSRSVPLYRGASRYIEGIWHNHLVIKLRWFAYAFFVDFVSVHRYNVFEVIGYDIKRINRI